MPACARFRLAGADCESPEVRSHLRAVECAQNLRAKTYAEKILSFCHEIPTHENPTAWYKFAYADDKKRGRRLSQRLAAHN
jgi:hypothetical protein